MGSEKQQTQQQQTVTPQRTAEQVELDRLQLAQAQAAQSGMIGAQQGGLALAGGLTRGGALPGAFANLYQGISPEMTREISQEAVADLPPWLQQSGILDSGVAASVMARTAGDVRRGSAQFNVGLRQALLGAALGSPMQTMQPQIQQTSALGQRLAAMASQQSTGQSTTTTPLLGKILAAGAQGLGQSMGKAAGGFVFGT